MSNLILLVGPSGSGKSSLAKELIEQDGEHVAATVYINQDSQGKDHLALFQKALTENKDIIVDRMNFNKQQRARYLNPAKERKYETKIIVLHENYETCLKRCVKRIGNHETVHTKEDAQNALNMFFSKYERPTYDEADVIDFRYPENTLKLDAIWCDIDNTLSDAEHREHFLKGEKRNWKGFLEHMHLDPVNNWCKKILNSMQKDHIICISSGRPDNYRTVTEKWLKDNNIKYDHLSMRQRSDSRQDYIVKENILDFEVLSRFNLVFALDDRKQVVEMLRSRDVLVLDCAGPKGDF